MKYINFLFIVFTFCIACKNNSRNTVSSNTSTLNEVLNVLPDEISNKTWVLILEGSKESYNEILDYSNKKISNNIITYRDSISFGVDEQVPLLTDKIKSVKKVANGYFITTLNSSVNIEFFWIKNRETAKWKINIPNYNGNGRDFNSIRYSVNKSYVTEKSFPSSLNKKNVSIVKGDIDIDLNIYSELIDDLPIKGQFSCTYVEEGRNYSGAFLKISKKNIKIKVEDVLYLQCNARKIKSSSNKYALFYKTFYTKYDPPEQSQYYSKTHPIAEIEILDDSTIKKKWLGMYNLKTKQIESIDGYFDWDDSFCDIIKKAN